MALPVAPSGARICEESYDSNTRKPVETSGGRLGNLTAIIDANKVAQSGHVANLVGIEPLADKWCAFGWEVREIDGHDMGQIVDALEALPFNTLKPSALMAHIVKGKGVSFAEDTYVWHSNTVTDEIFARALAELETL